MTQRLLLISPVHNEERYLELVARAVQMQTRTPDLWIVVDDGSTDGTAAMLTELSRRIAFLRVLTLQRAPDSNAVKDKLATAAAPRAFNAGLHSVDWRAYTHVAKLDGDTELPADYFERLLAEFEHDPALGLAGGIYADPDGHGGWRVIPVPLEHHVAGTLKCYSVECLSAIGGIQERLGWDTVDEVYARMRGFRTRTLADLVAHHHRPWASADGTLRGRARHGETYFILRYSPAWVLLRSLRVASAKPRGLSGLAFLFGYLRGAARGVPRLGDGEYRRFLRRELRHRIGSAIAARMHGRGFRPRAAG